MPEIEIEREDDGSIEVEIEIEPGEAAENGGIAVESWDRPDAGQLTVRFDGDTDVETDLCPDPQGTAAAVVDNTPFADEYRVRLFREKVWDVRFGVVYGDIEGSDDYPTRAVLTANGNLFRDGTTELVSDFGYERTEVLETAFEVFANTVLSRTFSDDEFGLSIREYGNSGGRLVEYDGLRC